MNKNEYLAFIHDPKHMIDPPEARMFDHPFLEYFSKTSWYIIPLVWFPVIFYYTYHNYFLYRMFVTQIISNSMP